MERRSESDAEKDAEIVNDGIMPEYQKIAKAAGFSNVQLCSGVPIVTYALTMAGRMALSSM